jgi:hypothetical protein
VGAKEELMLRRVRWSRLLVIALTLVCAALALRMRELDVERLDVQVVTTGVIPVRNPVIAILDSGLPTGRYVSEVEVPGGAIEVSDPIVQTLDELPLEIYDVRDLVPVHDYPRGAPPQEATLEALLWRCAGDAPGASMEIHKGQLIVSHTADGHARVVATLRDLRALR